MVILTNTSKLKDLKSALMVLFPKGIEIISSEAMEKYPITDPEMPLILQFSLDKPITPEAIVRTKNYYENEEVACICSNQHPVPFISRDPSTPKVRGVVVVSDLVPLSPDYLATVLKIPLPASAA